MTKNKNEYNLILEFLKDFRIRLVSYKKLILFRQFHQRLNDFRKILNKSSIKICKFHETLYFFQID